MIVNKGCYWARRKDGEWFCGFDEDECPSACDKFCTVAVIDMFVKQKYNDWAARQVEEVEEAEVEELVEEESDESEIAFNI